MSRLEQLIDYAKRVDKELDHKMQHGNSHWTAVNWESVRECLDASGVDWEECHQGYLVNGQFIISPKKRWRVKGKSKWYWYKDIPSLLAKLGLDINE